MSPLDVKSYHPVEQKVALPLCDYFGTICLLNKNRDMS